jgi:hypothetical protein
MNFGTIKDIHAKFLVDSYIKETKNSINKKIYKNFIKNLVENPILKTQFIVYKNIENGYLSSEVSAVEYLKENISLFDKFNKGDIIKENTKLGDKLNVTYKSYLVPGEMSQSTSTMLMNKSKSIHEAINNLITLEKSAETINTLHESFEVVKKWLTTPKEISEGIKKPTVDANKFLNSAVDKYNEKYSTLSEEEKGVIKSIMSTNKKEKEIFLKNMVKESIILINNILKEYGGNIDIKSKLLEAKDVVYNIEYNEETFKEDITKIYNLKNSLTD